MKTQANTHTHTHIRSRKCTHSEHSRLSIPYICIQYKCSLLLGLLYATKFNKMHSRSRDALVLADHQLCLMQNQPVTTGDAGIFI